MSVRFLFDDRVVDLDTVDPTLTVLRWLREQARRPGTKEGCAEGDCGACTVVLGERAGTPERPALRYRAVNACILFMPMLDGRQLLTVEDLRPAGGDLHPVQQAMVDCHASQCGFCTPGFVMSLFALFHSGRPLEEEVVYDALAGNLCRCTGYRPIVEAARRLDGEARHDAFSARAGETIARLAALRRDGDAPVTGAGRRSFAPRRLDELAALLQDHPDACLVAGATDVGLWVTKQHKRPDPIVHVSGVTEMARVEEADGHLVIGAAARYVDCLPALDRHFPSFAALVRRIGSEQIRNSGTIGGNVANGSPIGDSMPALIALKASVVLNRGGVRRTLALEDFYLGYRQTALQPGEFVEALRVPLTGGGTTFATYKVSKRRDQDISAVAAGFALTPADGRVAGFRAAYGGMAAVPKRAAAVEAALTGKPWTLETVTAAMAAIDADFQPLTDMRASRDYRRLVARNLLMRFYLETTGQQVTGQAGGQTIEPGSVEEGERHG